MGGRLAIVAALAGTLALPASALAAPGRVLLEGNGVRVTLAQPFRCGTRAELAVSASDPTLFAADSPRLQATVDAARAMLGFECRDIRGISVTGHLAGQEGQGRRAYYGTAGPEVGWQLHAEQSIQLSGGESGPAAPAPVTAGYRIADLSTGMDVRQALDATRRSFRGEPVYDRHDHVLRAAEGDCGAGFDWGRNPDAGRAGWRCLVAHFTRGRPGRLYQLRFVQVVDRNQAQAVGDTLVQRFGRPAFRHTKHAAGGWYNQGDGDVTTMGWGEPIGAENHRPLQARIEVRTNRTVLVLTLLDPALDPRTAKPRYQVNF